MQMSDEEKVYITNMVYNTCKVHKNTLLFILAFKKQVQHIMIFIILSD